MVSHAMIAMIVSPAGENTLEAIKKVIQAAGISDDMIIKNWDK